MFVFEIRKITHKNKGDSYEGIIYYYTAANIQNTT